jgi:ABC-type siderophore export system fused ATPase/permease subunit
VNNPLDDEQLKVVREQLERVGKIDNEQMLLCATNDVALINEEHQLTMYEEMVQAQILILRLSDYICQAEGMEKAEEVLVTSAKQASELIKNGEGKTVH